VKNSGGTTIASYAYDGLGRRIQETHSGTVNDLYYSSAWQVLEERTGGVSTATIQYVWSPVYVDALVLRDRSTQNNGTLDERLWVQQDANWNVTALVNSSGSVVERYIYDPYGQVTYLNANWATISASAYAWIYGSQGRRLDTATGNISARWRDVRPTIQRWLKLDPIGIRGGDTNLFRAEGDNPTTNGDPSGLAGNPTPDSWKTAGKKDTPVFQAKHPINRELDQPPPEASDRDYLGELVYGENFGRINYDIGLDTAWRDAKKWWKGGLGIGLQGDAGAGIGMLDGAGANGSLGTGLFFGGPTGFDWRGFASGGGFAGHAREVKPNDSGAAVFGGHAGVGALSF
jgi:RHS repeat-associated protein